MNISLVELQPSQLYINKAKLDQWEKRIRKKGWKLIPPVPVKKLDDELVLTDGHTRAYVRFRHGYHDIAFEWEDEDLDWRMYRVCIKWCKDQNIRMIADLDARILQEEMYQKLWIDRCQKMKKQLDIYEYKDRSWGR